MFPSPPSWDKDPFDDLVKEILWSLLVDSKSSEPELVGVGGSEDTLSSLFAAAFNCRRRACILKCSLDSR